MSKFYLEILENGERIPIGPWQGYATIEEAKEAAMKKVDDALPNNTVRIFQHVATAYLAGDGGEEVKDE